MLKILLFLHCDYVARFVLRPCSHSGICEILGMAASSFGSEIMFITIYCTFRTAVMQGKQYKVYFVK